ncbi:LLM class flavin-dependent oxidoreductase [Marinobacterium sedimentorum]|uniref:LLM class flavin-dependent oxidoreductase n=1 Tax=Marinobacterium sedimentorum TaxID=2927804 RepID=UPI0020C72E5F|nr:LLM class flavin-dependent oxidoreductase [Marinobacterium sedimentorum]MCP8686598.1 LLM class flavin-dependent oxidoreductase [Marinobacterium sedimentorum]
MTLKLTVIDQSPVPGKPQPLSAVALSARLAQACEQAGYARYWVAEHHNSINFAGPSPEILISHIASITERIRVGSGGVMLPHYSPYKVAEQFKLLETLFPGRIDLGIGRAPGGDGLASHALAYPHAQAREDHYAQQAALLKGFLTRSIPNQHPYHELQVMPDEAPCPELWMLGSSGGSAELAGQVGMKMALALFIGPEDRPVSIVHDYQNAWREAGHQGEPETLIAVAAVCADTGEEAEYLAASQVYWKVRAFRHGVRDIIKSPSEALDLKEKLGPSDQAYFDQTLASVVCGSPSQCLARLQGLGERYGTDEIGLVTVTHDFEHRLRSYALLAAHN